MTAAHQMLRPLTWFKQSAYLWRGPERKIYIDPWGVTATDPADLILITHAHSDHYSPEDIERIRHSRTVIIAPRDVALELDGNVRAVRPGDTFDVGGVKGTAVPAYNVVEERQDFHPRENEWVGYVLELGNSRYYHAGDTDHIEELDAIRADVAFLPVGGTYTMGPSEAAGLAREIDPQVAVPMHYGYAVGSPEDARRFALLSRPVQVEILEPEQPFERTY